LVKHHIISIFADGKRIITLSNSLKRLSEGMIIDCFVGKQQDKMKIKSIKHMGNVKARLTICATMINTWARMHRMRS
jgi:hypothetical protein